MELVRPISQPISQPVPPQREATHDRSPLASARLHRQLTVEEAAKRASLTPDQVQWLEEGRVYRFPSTDAAIEATLLLAAAFGIDRREARELAGLPVPPRPLDVNPAARLVGVAALSAALMGLVAFVLVPAVAGRPAPAVDPVVAQAATLPKPWAIQIDVLNGAGDINWTRQTASRIQSLAYTVKRVGRADRFDYPRSAVYYAPGGRLIAVRLARQIGFVTHPLPGGKDPNRLIVIVGPRRGPG
jgi:transcriptional regulator with XRE-family HTH domain